MTKPQDHRTENALEPGTIFYSKVLLTLPVEEQIELPVGTQLRVLRPDEIGESASVESDETALVPSGSLNEQPAPEFVVAVNAGEYYGARLSVTLLQVSNEPPASEETTHITSRNQRDNRGGRYREQTGF